MDIQAVFGDALGSPAATMPVLGAPLASASADIWRCSSWLHDAVFGGVPFLGPSTDAAHVSSKWPPIDAPIRAEAGGQSESAAPVADPAHAPEAEALRLLLQGALKRDPTSR